jgi:hypothetical protein
LNELDAKFQVAIDFVSTFAGKSIKNEQVRLLFLSIPKPM